MFSRRLQQIREAWNDGGISGDDVDWLLAAVERLTEERDAWKEAYENARTATLDHLGVCGKAVR